jgi:hypothetical protein
VTQQDGASAPESPRGVPDIRQAERPAWTDGYLTTDQRRVASPALQWLNLVRKSTSLGRDAKGLLYELYVCVHTFPEGRVMEWNPGLDKLRLHTGIGTDNLTKGWKQAAAQGWLHVIPGRPNTYRLTWPSTDCMSSEALICGQWAESKGHRGKVCGNRPGQGTITPGTGPCVLHGGTPKPEGSGLNEETPKPEPSGLTEPPKPEGSGLNEVPEQPLSPEVRALKPGGPGALSPEVRALKPGGSGAKVLKEQGFKEQEQKKPVVPEVSAEVEDTSRGTRDEKTIFLDGLPVKGAPYRAIARRHFEHLGVTPTPAQIDAYAYDQATGTQRGATA